MCLTHIIICYYWIVQGNYVASAEPAHTHVCMPTYQAILSLSPAVKKRAGGKKAGMR